MKWRKLGLVYAPSGSRPWARHSALTPTPLLLNERVIRVFAGFRDAAGVSRIGYVDVAADDPGRVLQVSPDPVLDVGRPGTFDDNGVILGDVVRDGDEIRMYYVGFQIPARVKFLAFTGLAVSRDGGSTFARAQPTPVGDRAGEGSYIRAVHTALREEGVWKFWYAAGDSWEHLNGQPFPAYHIRYAESPDGLSLPAQGTPCITCCGDEYRIGRPRVYRLPDKYLMFYTRGDRHGGYLAGVAESRDGRNWTRRDDQLGIRLSETGWDSRHLSYPALIAAGGRVFMFYNGNDMGREGFGCAELLEW
jgi:hypothetical protein